MTRHSGYDVVCIGSGLGGISAAAFLARSGKRVLVVERLDGPGGYAHAFQRGPYTFDPAIRTIGQGVAEPMLDTMLASLGVADECELLPVDDLYRTALPGFELVVPKGRDAFVAAHAERFPRGGRGVDALIETCARMTSESLDFMSAGVSLAELDSAARSHPTLFRYLKATVADVVAEHIDDPRLAAVCTASWPYLGVAPSRLSFFAWSAMLMSLLERGAYGCRGGFQSLVNALASAFERSGGELVLKTEARRIIVENGRVAGVELGDGERVAADVVISNADATRTLLDLVGAEHLPNGLSRRLGRMTPSLSAFLLYGATTLDARAAGAAHESFVFDTWDHDQAYGDVLRGRPGGLSLSVPTLTDPSLAPDGEHIVTLMAFAPFDRPWSDLKGRYTDMLLDELDVHLPGARAQLTHLEAATPLALARYSGNRDGAVYGWENTALQNGVKRLGHIMPVKGLYLSGHWTQPGTGSLGALYSGLQTAQMVAGCADPAAFLRSLTYQRAAA